MERALRFKARDGKPFRRAGLAFGPDWTEVDPAAADPEAVTRLAAEESLDAQVQDEAGEWVALPAEAREMARAQLVALDPRDWAEIRAEAKPIAADAPQGEGLTEADRIALAAGHEVLSWLDANDDQLRAIDPDLAEGEPLEILACLVERVTSDAGRIAELETALSVFTAAPPAETPPAEERGGTGDDAPPPPPARKGGGKAKGD